METISGSLISLVSQQGFHATYRKTVARIGSVFHLEYQLDEAQLEVAHRLWASEIANSLNQENIKPSDKDFWINVLSALSYYVCSAKCVSYQAKSEQEKNLQKLQLLLMEFPNEYTGLEFVKTLHLDTFFRLRTHRPAATISGLQLSFIELGTILHKTRATPEAARDYVRLLKLPAD
jgi:hypothetical protein